MSNDYYKQDQIQHDNYYQDDVYTKVVRAFEERLLTQYQYDSFCSYMKANCDILFTRDMMNFLEDYNALITQAVQAIKSLQTENSQLKEINMMNISKEGGSSNNNNIEPGSYSNEKVDSYRNESKIILKQPLRQQLKEYGKASSSRHATTRSHHEIEVSMPLINSNIQMEPSKDEIISIQQSPEFLQKQQEAAKAKELETIQITNEILKQIPIIQNNQKHFLSSYSPQHTFKEFLSNIIEYKYDPITIENILKDIQKMSKSDKQPSTNTKQALNTSNNPIVTHHDFTGSLRNYSKSNEVSQLNQKPFNQFTSPYGRLFKHN